MCLSREMLYKPYYVIDYTRQHYNIQLKAMYVYRHRGIHNRSIKTCFPRISTLKTQNATNLFMLEDPTKVCGYKERGDVRIRISEVCRDFII